MQQLTRQFGPEFVKWMSASSTLAQDVLGLKQRGVQIRRVKEQGVAYSTPDQKRICIGRGTLQWQLANLGHEACHIFDVPIEERFVSCKSRHGFINACLWAEARSVVHELAIAGELHAAGLKMGAEQRSWYRAWKQGGIRRIRQGLECTPVSTSSDLYRLHYGKIYDGMVMGALAAITMPEVPLLPACKFGFRSSDFSRELHQNSSADTGGLNAGR